MRRRFQDLPWLTAQIVAANVAVISALAAVWYLAFLRQSATYSDRLMATFNIEPGMLHAMYVDDVERQLWSSVGIALAAAVLASIALAYLIVRPIRTLAVATERMRHGDYQVRSAIATGEIGRLAKNVNALAVALEHEERRRSQYMADLSHELRTPITSLRGYTEGLEDGVFRADERFFALMADELGHLTALTHTIDAMQLDVVPDREGGTQQGLPIGALIEETVARWKARLHIAGLGIEAQASPIISERVIEIPESSMRQITDNLMSNMVRYASGTAPCTISATKGAKPNTVRLVFSNQAPDLEERTVPFLFDRFFRGSGSRTRSADDRPSGLGLSIVKQRCLANNGSADAALDSGVLRVEINLPLRRQRRA